MRAVDTNVVVRLIVRDDPVQVRAAEQFTSSGAWVSHLVLAETSWVLDAVYERTAAQIAPLLAGLPPALQGAVLGELLAIWLSRGQHQRDAPAPRGPARNRGRSHPQPRRPPILFYMISIV